MAEMIKVLFCPPGQKPKLLVMSNEIPEIEKLLDGRLGVKDLGDGGIFLLYNDEGDKKALDINRLIQQEPIFGACIFCRQDGDRFASLTDEEITDLEHLLS
jgi:hypothetical protein